MTGETGVAARLGIADVFAVKVELLGQIARLQALDGEIRGTFERINGYSPIDLRERYETHAQDAPEKYVDKACWRYLVSLFHLEKYMLCSDYARLQEDIDGCRTLPEKTAKALMRAEKREEYSNEFFALKVCRNGNTHYTLSDEIRDKLNRYGPEGAVLGEDIKIKIVERWAS